MIVLGLAVGYLAMGVIAAAIASRWITAADAIALALLWPIYGPILLERTPRDRRRATLDDEVERARAVLAEARAQLADAEVAAERSRQIAALKAQVVAVQTKIDAVQAAADAPGNKPADPGVSS